MDIETLSIIIFFGITTLLLWLDRKNLEFHFIVAMRKTKKGIKLLEKFTRQHKRFLKILGIASIIVGILGMLFGVWYLLDSASKALQHPKKAVPALKMLFPRIPGVSYPSFVQGVPFWYWIIAILIVVSVHEPMHALMALAEKIKVKTMGLLFLGPLPIGAFADPDEKKLQRLNWLGKIKIYAAGSFGNFMAALLAFLLFILTIYTLNSIWEPYGVAFNRTIDNTPAEKVGLNGIILGINGTRITSIGELGAYLAGVRPNSTIVINTTTGVYTLVTQENPKVKNASFIGIESPKTVFVYKKSGKIVSNTLVNATAWVLGLFNWLFLINLGVAVVNLLPLKPFDGGYIAEELIKRFVKKKYRKLALRALFFFTVALIFFNMFGPSLLSFLR